MRFSIPIGAQYTSAEFDAFTARRHIRRSLGRTGVCWDNAAAESFFAALKNEMYYRQTFATRARARFAVAEYIEVFYNRRRLHSTLGYRTPFRSAHRLPGCGNRRGVINSRTCPRSLTQPNQRHPHHQRDEPELHQRRPRSPST